MSELKKALNETKKKLRDVADEVRETVNIIRPEEPLISKTRKILGNPIRRRLRRRIYKRREGEEENAH